MALNGPGITAAIEAGRLAGIFPLLGLSFSQIAAAVGMAIQAWGIGNPANLALMGAATGAGGLGFINPGTSRIFVAPNPGLVIGGLAGSGVVGPVASSVATAVSVGIAASFSSLGQYTGLCPLVATGPDISSFGVVNGVTLAAILSGIMAGMVGPTPSSAMLASGLASGITAQLLTGAGLALVVPAPGAPPPGPVTLTGATGPSMVV